MKGKREVRLLSDVGVSSFDKMGNLVTPGTVIGYVQVPKKKEKEETLPSKEV